MSQELSKEKVKNFIALLLEEKITLSDVGDVTNLMLSTNPKPHKYLEQLADEIIDFHLSEEIPDKEKEEEKKYVLRIINQNDHPSAYDGQLRIYIKAFMKDHQFIELENRFILVFDSQNEALAYKDYHGYKFVIEELTPSTKFYDPAIKKEKLYALRIKHGINFKSVSCGELYYYPYCSVFSFKSTRDDRNVTLFRSKKDAEEAAQEVSDVYYFDIIEFTDDTPFKI